MSECNFSLMLITNNPDISKHAVSCGVDRIFVDLEINGKYERQGHLDTVISKHQMSDIGRVRDSIGDAQLLVRINPCFDNSEYEINQAIELGADIIMLPMFRTLDEINYVSDVIKKRVKFIPLVETIDAANILSDVVNVDGVSEIYFGLNDLHREMNLKFMFQPLQDGSLEKLVNVVKSAGLPFGFGGVARVGEGILSAEQILSEHIRLGSSSVILSRTFHRNSLSLSDLVNNMDLKMEISKIREVVSEHRERKASEILKDKHNLDLSILNIVNGL